MSQANPQPPRGIQWSWIIIGLLAVAITAGFLVKGLENNIQYYMTVGEYLDRQPKYRGKRIKIAGKVAVGSLQVDGNRYEFKVEDLGKSIDVRYLGFVPDTFKEGVEVVVEGQATSEPVFVAESLMAKCASKYEAGGLPPLEKMRGKSVY